MIRAQAIVSTIFSLALGSVVASAADGAPAPQAFLQEFSRHRDLQAGLLSGRVQCMELTPSQPPRVLIQGQWIEWQGDTWKPAARFASANPNRFRFPDIGGSPIEAPIRADTVLQILHHGPTNYVVTGVDIFRVQQDRFQPLGWPHTVPVTQAAVAQTGELYTASRLGVHQFNDRGWNPVRIADPLGRLWAAENALGIAVDTTGRLWVGSLAGVAVRSQQSWRFFEGKDGLPWNEFTGIAAGPGNEVWLGTRRGAIRWDGSDFHYRQGQAWLPDDAIERLAVGADGTAWFATAKGIGQIGRRPMRLADKAELYEQEIEKYIQRTAFGYVSEAGLSRAGDKSSFQNSDSDNDGLWTAMYGAGECFSVAATGNPTSRVRARKVFEALRFLQKVTQGGTPQPPKGYVARTIRSIDLPDPNIGRLASDKEEQTHDKLWKAYEPRWPKSADGKWYWKSDTSSDELDGHYFFYALYYEWVADSEAERDRVREVVRDLTDHLLAHDGTLTDHDGTPTRWGMYSPAHLNRDPMWWPERGLNSLSLLSYLTVAHYVTGDAKYATARSELVEKHGYAHNAMYAKVQHGPGSGNQSDDEMAFMCYYSLLRHCSDPALTAMIRYSFFRYWANESPEVNPFFNFAFAAHALGQSSTNPFGTYSIAPWDGWLEDSMATLRGFSLERIPWGHQNSHRLDVVLLPTLQNQDLYDRRQHKRGHRLNGKVLPVENRYFNHWNTDPWALDYGGNGHELGSGTVFLLPYYMGLFHGFIEKP